MHTLTKRQTQILSLLNSYTQTKGYSPSYRELMQVLGLSSPATVAKHIKNLIDLGHIKKTSRGWRTLKPVKNSKTTPATKNEIAIIGGVSKGKKIELYAQVAFFELPSNLHSVKNTLYGFTIQDMSFAAFHIVKDDLIIVEARQEPHSGEMILAHSKKMGAQIGAYMVTYSDHKIHRHIQSSPKEAGSPIAPASLSFEDPDLHIQGVVVGLFREYQVSESSSVSGSKSSKA